MNFHSSRYRWNMSEEQVSKYTECPQFINRGTQNMVVPKSPTFRSQNRYTKPIVIRQSRAEIQLVLTVALSVPGLEKLYNTAHQSPGSNAPDLPQFHILNLPYSNLQPIKVYFRNNWSKNQLILHDNNLLIGCLQNTCKPPAFRLTHKPVE